MSSKRMSRANDYRMNIDDTITNAKSLSFFFLIARKISGKNFFKIFYLTKK